MAGCGGAPPPRAQPRPTYLSAELPELIARANAWTAAALRARGQLRMYWSGDEDSRHVDINLFASRSGALVLQGRRSLAGTIFNLISDGLDFQLVVPDHAAHYRGTSTAAVEPDPERPYFALRPHHITEALLPEPLPAANAPGSYVSRQTYPDLYALVWVQSDNDDVRVRRKVWVRRDTLQVSQIEGFDGDGRIAFVASYSDYPGRGRDAYPRTIEVERPWEELTFRFDLTEAERNPVIPDAAFRFQELPGGYRALTIEQAMAEFRAKGGG